jgi:hypothetical protein
MLESNRVISPFHPSMPWSIIISVGVLSLAFPLHLYFHLMQMILYTERIYLFTRKVEIILNLLWFGHDGDAVGCYFIHYPFLQKSLYTFIINNSNGAAGC